MSLTVLISCMDCSDWWLHLDHADKGDRCPQVLGASVANLVRILCIDFVKPVLLAFVIAAPLAAWSWTNGRVVRLSRADELVDLRRCRCILLIAALVTLSFQTVRTALIVRWRVYGTSIFFALRSVASSRAAWWSTKKRFERIVRKAINVYLWKQ